MSPELLTSPDQGPCAAGSDCLEPRFLWLTGALMIGTASMMGLSSAAYGSDTSAQGASMMQYQTDLSCAAAAQIWALQMPQDLPKERQNAAWTAATFFAAHAQVSGHALGYSPTKVAGSIVVFQQMGLPEVRAMDPAMVNQKNDHLAEAVQHCQDLPVFKNRPEHFDDFNRQEVQ